MNKNEILGMLDEQVKADIERLSDKNLSHEDRLKIIKELQSVHGLRVEEIKVEKDKTDIVFRTVVDGAKILIPLTFYGIWMKKGFKFEETGTFTSNTFKNLISNFKPKF